MRTERSRALEGIRVLDLTIISAGAGATMLLADMGAEVIKVESTKYVDPYRNSTIHPNDDPGDHPWNRSAPFNTLNRNKYGITLDLTHPEGKAIFLELAKTSDVVANNFRLGVMERFGLGYEEISRVNPSIVYVDISSQGTFGPEARYGSFGSTLDALSGLAYVTGEADGPPSWSGQTINYPDQLACTLAAGAIMTALYYRMQTGLGAHIDFSQRESITSLIGEMVLDSSLNDRQPVRLGNGHAFMVPHGVYPCAGNDEWITIAVAGEDQWSRLCAVLARPELLDDERFADYTSRYAHRAELDGIIAEWTIVRAPHEAFTELQTAGIAAGAVVGGPEILADPQLRDRGYFQVVEQPEAGSFPIKTRPMKFSKTDGSIYRHAPLLGEHNNYVFHEVLGLSAEKVQHLERQGVIGTKPVDA